MTAIAKLFVYLAVLLVASVVIWAATLYGFSPLGATLVGLGIASVGAFVVASGTKRRVR